MGIWAGSDWRREPGSPGIGWAAAGGGDWVQADVSLLLVVLRATDRPTILAIGELA